MGKDMHNKCKQQAAEQKDDDVDILIPIQRNSLRLSMEFGEILI